MLYSSCTACDVSNLLIQGLCVSQCPTGYNEVGQTCEMDSDGLAFNLKLSKIQDVVYDLKSNIPIVTGVNSQFYPNYGSRDPYPAIQRGYYFNGSSFMSFPSNYHNL